MPARQREWGRLRGRGGEGREGREGGKGGGMEREKKNSREGGGETE